MTPVAREFFTVDLRGLRAALSARAAHTGMTESDVLRSAVAAALGNTECVPEVGSPCAGDPPSATHQIKLCVRLPHEVALLSRDINHLAQLLRRGSTDAARQYAERLETLDADVRSHLALAAATLAELAPARRAASRSTRIAATHPWSTP